MFKSFWRFGVQTLKHVAAKRSTQIASSSLLAVSVLCQLSKNEVQSISNNKKSSQVSSSQAQNESGVIVENEAIFLNKQTYMSRLLGNKKENYVLVVHAEDNQEDTNNAIKTAKHLKSIQKKDGVDLNVYVVSRPTLEDVRKIANRIMDFKIFEREENPQKIEIYIKTEHANECVYVKWRRESFFTDYKSKKFTKKLTRYINLFKSFPATTHIQEIQEQEQRLANLLQKQYLKLDEPVILKCATSPASFAKEVKQFKKICFFCVERKLIPLKSKLVIIENRELARSLGIKEGDIYILRNDFVQKLENSVEITSPLGQSIEQPRKLIIDDACMYIRNERNSLGKNEKLSFFSHRIENYSTFKNDNEKLMKNIESISRDQGNAQSKEDLEVMKEQAIFVNFVMPRINFLRDSKFGSIGKLFKKITFAKDKHVLSLNLQSDDKLSNHSRFITFRELYQQYKNEFTFLLVDSDELADLFPHIDNYQPQFSLFNFFNVDKSLSKVSKYYKHLIFPFEKYFLIDPECFYERTPVLSHQIDTILLQQAPKDFVVNQTDLVQPINGEIFDSLLRNSAHPFLVQIIDESPLSRLASLTLNNFQLDRLASSSPHFPNLQIFRMSNLNQHHLLKGQDISEGPIYLYADPKNKSIILAPPNNSFSKPESVSHLQSFLENCQNYSLNVNFEGNSPKIEQSLNYSENVGEMMQDLSESVQLISSVIQSDRHSAISPEIEQGSSSALVQSNGNVQTNIQEQFEHKSISNDVSLLPTEQVQQIQISFGNFDHPVTLINQVIPIDLEITPIVPVVAPTIPTDDHFISPEIRATNPLSDVGVVSLSPEKRISEAQIIQASEPQQLEDTIILNSEGSQLENEGQSQEERIE